jgi:hypothetical protein
VKSAIIGIQVNIVRSFNVLFCKSGLPMVGLTSFISCPSIAILPHGKVTCGKCGV